MSGFDPTYFYLSDHLHHLLSCFFDVWSQMCKAFIPEFYMNPSGGNYYPHWSYLLPVLGIGFCFISIAFTKKLIFIFIERSEARV